MANKLMKLKSVLKKLNSFNARQSNTRHAATSSAAIADECSSANLHPVYVRKSRRQYLISSDVVDHPLFHELAERSNQEDDDNDAINVSCEVVLFEHLLWMLDNADSQPEQSIEELAQFYAY